MQRYSLAKPYDPVGNIFYYGMHSGALNLRDDYAASSAENTVFSYSCPALFMQAYTAVPLFCDAPTRFMPRMTQEILLENKMPQFRIRKGFFL